MMEAGEQKEEKNDEEEKNWTRKEWWKIFQAHNVPGKTTTQQWQ